MTGTAVDRRALVASAALVVCLAAVIPYLSTINNYFVRDDFGVVELLATKPATYFPRWFVSAWTDDIWGGVADEVRPFPAVSYQLTALGGAASPFLHHALNIALHAANGLVVLALALTVARLSVPASTLAAAVFVLLPVHGESVAWITGRVDSMPALFYMIAFWAFARWRAEGSRSRPLYALSLAMLFVALFTKQTTITMVATLAAWDLLTAGWPAALWPRLRAYVPFALMTAAYLGLRYLLFGQVVRVSQLNADGLACFGRLLERPLANVLTGQVSADVAAWALLVAVACCAVGLVRGLPPAEGRRTVALLVFFGPVWWLIGVAPTAVAGYESPRHVYLAAVAWAMVLGFLADLAWARARTRRWQRAVGAVALVVCAFYAVRLHQVVAEWNRMAAVSHRAVLDVRGEVLASPPGTLVIVGAPRRSWEWSVPFAVRPPFTRIDLTERAFIVTPWLLHCCRSQWFDDTRRILKAWDARHAAAPIVVLRWDPETGALSRATDREYPALRTLSEVLLQLNSREALDSNILRMVEELPGRTGESAPGSGIKGSAIRDQGSPIASRTSQ
jgi:hypothetical protein